MTLSTRAEILRALQEGEFERVGGTRTTEVDVRVVAATNKDMETAIRAVETKEEGRELPSRAFVSRPIPKTRPLPARPSEGWDVSPFLSD